MPTSWLVGRLHGHLRDSVSRDSKGMDLDTVDSVIDYEGGRDLRVDEASDVDGNRSGDGGEDVDLDILPMVALDAVYELDIGTAKGLQLRGVAEPGAGGIRHRDFVDLVGNRHEIGDLVLIYLCADGEGDGDVRSVRRSFGVF